MKSFARHSLALAALVALAGLAFLPLLAPTTEGLGAEPPPQLDVAGDSVLLTPRTEIYRQSLIGTPASYSDPGVDAVRIALRTTLMADYPSNQALVNAVQATLEDVYEDVATTQAASVYTWVFNPVTNRWERVCSDKTTFVLDPDDPDPVIVDLTTYVIVPV